jgi:hypothetical protein
MAKVSCWLSELLAHKGRRRKFLNVLGLCGARFGTCSWLAATATRRREQYRDWTVAIFFFTHVADTQSSEYDECNFGLELIAQL